MVFCKGVPLCLQQIKFKVTNCLPVTLPRIPPHVSMINLGVFRFFDLKLFIAREIFAFVNRHGHFKV